jgi:hypothetical protein
MFYTSEGRDSGEQTGGEESHLANFMKEIHTLGSREDIEESVPPQIVMSDTQPSSTVPAQAPVSEAPPTFWHQVMDANSNHPYYWNPVTNEVSWTLPEGGVISYEGIAGGDEKGEPLDYFAYYDEGIIVPDRKGKGRGEVAGPASEGVKKAEEGEKQKDEEMDEKEREKTAKKTGTEESQEQGSEVSGGTGTSGGGTKRKYIGDESEEGESQLMPTNKDSAHSSEGVSPPKKMLRGPSPRSIAKTTPEDKPKKQRSAQGSGSSIQAMRFQVSSLADELSRKLQFLHVSTEGLADMQILQVQVKTRLADWEEGGLETKFLLSKLKQASEALLSYEIEAAPKGWRFLWDSRNKCSVSV